jgi:hypothetical protein
MAWCGVRDADGCAAIRELAAPGVVEPTIDFQRADAAVEGQHPPGALELHFEKRLVEREVVRDQDRAPFGPALLPHPALHFVVQPREAGRLDGFRA